MIPVEFWHWFTLALPFIGSAGVFLTLSKKR